MDRKVGQPHIDHEIQDPRYHLSKLLDLLANKVVPPNVMFVLLNPIKKQLIYLHHKPYYSSILATNLANDRTTAEYPQYFRRKSCKYFHHIPKSPNLKIALT